MGATGDPTRLDRPSQVLLRAEARRGGESAKLRLTLRYWHPERFELRASDPFGRGVWLLATAGELGLWTDLREERACRFAAAERVRLDVASLPLPSRALPAVLLGVLPTRLPDPRAAVLAADGGSTVEFDDADGRRWRVRLAADGALRSWELAEREIVELEWEGAGERRRLRSREPEFEIEWREVAHERLVAPAPDLAAEAREAPECVNGQVS